MFDAAGVPSPRTRTWGFCASFLAQPVLRVLYLSIAYPSREEFPCCAPRVLSCRSSARSFEHRHHHDRHSHGGLHPRGLQRRSQPDFWVEKLSDAAWKARAVSGWSSSSRRRQERQRHQAAEVQELINKTVDPLTKAYVDDYAALDSKTRVSLISAAGVVQGQAHGGGAQKGVRRVRQDARHRQRRERRQMGGKGHR